MTTSQDTSLAELQADLAELESEFAELAAFEPMDHHTEEAYAALDAELAGSGFEASSQADMLTALSAEGDPEVNALVFGILRRIAQRVINQLLRFIRKHRQCFSCVPMVTRAVLLFKAGRPPGPGAGRGPGFRRDR